MNRTAMPTAARIVAAVLMGMTMFLAAEASKAGLPAGTQVKYYSPIVCAIGALTGWLVMGGLAGRGYGPSLGFGVRTAVTAVFWVLLLFSLWQMIELSMKMRFDGPMQAILGTFGLMVENSRLAILPEVLVTLGVGGVITGLAVEWAERRWN